MKFKNTYRKMLDTVYYIIIAAVLWGVAVLMEYAPEAWQSVLSIVSGVCLAGSLILIFFVIQRFLSERFNQVTMLQRMHAHVLYGRLNILDVQLSSFLGKLGSLSYPQDMVGFSCLEENLPPMNDVAWCNSLLELVKASRLPREDRGNFRVAFKALQELMQTWDKFKVQQQLDPTVLIMWQSKLRQITDESITSLRKVLWHIEA